MDRLEAVADVGQGARHDHAHRVVEVARRASRPRCGWRGCRPGRRSRSASPAVGQVERWLGGGWRGSGRPHAGERGGGRGGARGGRGARPAADAGEAGAELGRAAAGSSLARVSRMTQARWPSSVARRGLGLARRNAATAAAVDDASASGSAQERAFWTSGSASPISSARSGRPWSATSGSRPRRRSTCGIVAIVEPTRRRSQRDGE